MNKQINQPSATRGRLGKPGAVSRTLQFAFLNNRRLLSRASAQTEHEVLEIIHVLATSLSRVQPGSSSHFTTGYVLCIRERDMTHGILGTQRFNHFVVLSTLCKQDGVAVTSYQNAIIKELLSAQNAGLFLGSKVCCSSSSCPPNRCPYQVQDNKLYVRIPKDGGDEWFDLSRRGIGDSNYLMVYHYFEAMLNLLADLCMVPY